MATTMEVTAPFKTLASHRSTITYFNYILQFINHSHNITLFYLLGNPQVKCFHFTEEETEAQKDRVYKVLEPRSSRARTQTQVSYTFLVLSTSGCQHQNHLSASRSRGPPNECGRLREGTVSLDFSRCLV